MSDGDDDVPVAPDNAPPVVGVLAAIVLPLVAFGASEAGLDEILLPAWNDGTPMIFAKLAFAAPVQRWFYPLIGWAMLAYAAFVTGRRARWIEVGLFGGAILAGGFSALFLPKLPAAVVGTLFYGIGLLGFTPFCALAAYGLAAARYRQQPDALPLDGRAWGFWGLWSLVGLGGAYRAHQTMLALYVALPTEAPDCYLATVASLGAPRVVRSRPVRFGDGTIRPVTRQLQVFKAFEITLRALAPRTHAVVRRSYDVLGPPIAARMSRRTATAAWLLLAPVALVAEIVLRLLFRGADALVASTYGWDRQADVAMPVCEAPPPLPDTR